MKRLLRDVEAGLIDVVVTYKLDRLSRSLTDFAKLIDVFEQHAVSFISITQQFSTTSSMGPIDFEHSFILCSIRERAYW